MDLYDNSVVLVKYDNECQELLDDYSSFDDSKYILK